MSGMEKITSRDNQHLIDARKVRDGKIRERIFIEGRRLVGEALRSEISVIQGFIVEGFADSGLAAEAAGKVQSMIEVPERVFSTISNTDHSQGIILIADRPTDGKADLETRLRSRSNAPPIVLFLKQINNPSNLGAVLRTADAAGVAGVIVSDNSTDVYSPRSLRGSMGAAFRLPVWENSDLARVLNWAKAEGLMTTATDIRAARPYNEIDWSVPRLLIFGSEAHGLTETDVESVDEKIRIPLENDVESLNLAVSAGIILFEAKRQNSGSPG